MTAEGRDWNAKGEAISTPLTNLSHLPKMVSRARLKSILTGLALYAMAAAIVGYFGVNAYTGKYGLNARQELDQEIIALTQRARPAQARARQERAARVAAADRRGSTLTCWTSGRAFSSTMSIRTISFG